MGYPCPLGPPRPLPTWLLAASQQSTALSYSLSYRPVIWDRLLSNVPCKAIIRARLPLTITAQVKFGLVFGIRRHQEPRSNYIIRSNWMH